MSEPGEVRVVVPTGRADRWVANFVSRHGALDAVVRDGRYVASDGSWFEVSSLFAPQPLAEGFEGSPSLPEAWGVVLVRKGGFAVARMAGAEMVSSKVGRRHVQGRTKAGGQSQQRFSRRRDNQARQAYEACADHAAAHLSGLVGPVLTGGDLVAVDEVFADRRLAQLTRSTHSGDVVEPRRVTLEEFVARCGAWQVRVHNAAGAGTTRG